MRQKTIPEGLHVPYVSTPKPAEPLPTGGLAIAGVSHAFRDTRALSDISFAVADGEVVALLGPSGCGKSTLLRCIAGLIAPDHGTITLNGQDLRKIPARSRAIGMVFQNMRCFRI